MKPHFLAATQYTVLAIFLWASWLLLLFPLEQAVGQLEFIFSPNYENRTFFIFFAIAAAVSTILGIAFWFQRSTSSLVATLLAVISVFCFAIALWLFDSSLILGFGLGCTFAIWSRFSPNPSFKRDA